MIFLYFCKFFVPRSEEPPLTLYRPGDSQDYQSFDFSLNCVLDNKTGRGGKHSA